MNILIFPASGHPAIDIVGDRGCVSCGFVIDTRKPRTDDVPGSQDRRTFIIDGRGRYWCADCAVDALTNVRRRVDERTHYVYPWRFEDTGGPDGQHSALLHNSDNKTEVPM